MSKLLSCLRSLFWKPAESVPLSTEDKKRLLERCFERLKITPFNVDLRRQIILLAEELGEPYDLPMVVRTEQQ
jgi:hypothetical protein